MAQFIIRRAAEADIRIDAPLPILALLSGFRPTHCGSRLLPSSAQPRQMALAAPMPNEQLAKQPTHHHRTFVPEGFVNQSTFQPPAEIDCPRCGAKARWSPPTRAAGAGWESDYECANGHRLNLVSKPKQVTNPDLNGRGDR